MTNEYYGSWKTDEIKCEKCGWSGIGDECNQGEMFEQLFEIDCPICSARLNVILFPTIEESRANWDRVSDGDKLMVEAREQFLAQAESSCLKSADQLPDLNDEEIVLVWDRDIRANDTVIRYGNSIIWREPVFYGGSDRFYEVAQLLSKKYGPRIKDLVFTLRSEGMLWGDALHFPQEVEKARKQLWTSSRETSA
jgi:hypothetical protein